jgi:hypothetical protein
VKGELKVSVRNRRNSYVFTLRRNITVLTGNSGTGKTTLYDMIREYAELGKSSGVTISAPCPVVALEGKNWELELENTENSIVVVDEDNWFLRSEAFARAVRRSSNYFLLITRQYLHQLPYSVTEIYKVVGNKNKRFEPIYTDIDHMYDHPLRRRLPFHPDVIITEDSRAGSAFFHAVADKFHLQCVSAEGKSNCLRVIESYTDKNIVVIADGAAFGSDMEALVRRQQLTPNKIALFLPESFEWLILESGIVTVSDRDYLEHPADYADSGQYESWEQYFTEVLENTTQDIPYARYNKNELKDFYLQAQNEQAVLDQIPGISFGSLKKDRR